jgi:hypothetical protein
MSNYVTFGDLIYMIIGWTVGRIIGIILIDRLEKRNNRLVK